MNIQDSCLIIVDFQNDFCLGGSIPFCEPALYVSKINKLINYFTAHHCSVLASQDWHPLNHISFLDNQDLYKDLIEKENIKLFPVHCVQNTKGAEIYEGIEKDMINEFFHKGMNPLMEQFSAFNALAINHNNLTLHEYIFNKQIKDIYLCGLALDYSVIKTALDFNTAGFKTFIIWDSTVPLEDKNIKQIQEMCKNLGISFITTEEIFKN